MATLQHPFFSLMTFLLASSLVIALFSCFPVKVQALENIKANTERHFHTLQISSLLPASVCSPSTGSNKRQSTLKVVHRHGPCSKSTTTQPLEEILSSDQSRVESIQARLKPDPNTNKLNDHKTPNKNNKFKKTKADLPAQPGQSFNSGNYLVTIGLGNPKKALSLIFDTGSDLTWTQCQPCAGSCHQQIEPVFDPSASSSYSNISCSSSECAQLPSATGNIPGCYADTCVYNIRYGDRSFSIGFLGKDEITLTPNDVFPNFLFGCGQNNQGLFGYTAGIIGLGRDNLSMVSQTAQKYEKYFSYCLPSISSSTGHLTFGKNNVADSLDNVNFTPFANSQGTSLYFIDIISIFVGGKQLQIDQSVFKTAGTIIDSGTVITRLPPGAYGPMSAAFRELMKKYPRTGAYQILDTCYDLTSYTSIEIPTISIIFKGDVKVELDASGILITLNSTVACLAFAGNVGAGDLGIFGNTQQKTMEVVYDVAGGQLGFGAGGCM